MANPQVEEQTPPYPDWIYNESAMLPYRERDGALQVLLISSRRSGRWVVPKGIVEPGMTAVASAMKEAYEEAGVEGEPVHESLGTYEKAKWGGTCRIAVYPCRVSRELESWPEAGQRQRRWFSLEEAGEQARPKGLRALVARLPDALRRASTGRTRRAAEPEPARRIYLLRHAKSSWEEPDLADFDRPLAPRGERACESISRYIALGDLHPDRIVCSASVRTRQTLAAVTPALGEAPEPLFYRGLYLAGPKAMLDRLRRTDEGARSVMLVAHNPGTQGLALLLAGSGPAEELARMQSKLPTGALVTLLYNGSSWKALEPGSCELHSFVCPRDIGPEPEQA